MSVLPFCPLPREPLTGRVRSVLSLPSLRCPPIPEAPTLNIKTLCPHLTTLLAPAAAAASGSSGPVVTST